LIVPSQGGLMTLVVVGTGGSLCCGGFLVLGMVSFELIGDCVCEKVRMLGPKGFDCAEGIFRRVVVALFVV
jgi:hypothetical protein